MDAHAGGELDPDHLDHAVSQKTVKTIYRGLEVDLLTFQKLGHCIYNINSQKTQIYFQIDTNDEY